MKIDIAKADLQIIRDHVRWRILHSVELRDRWQERGSISVAGFFGNDVAVLKKLNRKINAALKQVHGHDCNGGDYV